VLNAAGALSLRREPGAELTQRLLLEREGIRFDARGRVNLARVRWQARSRRRSA
jgi:methylated-DNA-protein-cysteine methyltransferase related protein